MRFIFGSSLPVLLWPTVILARSIRRDDAPVSFQVYGYGDGIGGLELFSAGGAAFVGDYKLGGNNESAPVIFTPTDLAWIASPNTTETDRPTWDHYKFAIPSDSSESREVGFVSQDTQEFITDSFYSYGTVVFVSGKNGQVESNWYAVPSETEGVYALKWRSDDIDGVLLTLKATPPSN